MTQAGTDAVMMCEDNEGYTQWLRVRVLVVDAVSERAVVSDGLDRWVAALRDLTPVH